MFDNGWFLIIIIGFLLLRFLIEILVPEFTKAKHAKQKKEKDIFLMNNHPIEKDIQEFSYWRKYIEPKYSNSNFYPPDWQTRKKYIAEIYNYKCGLCFKEERLGHSHHIISLSDGGTNNINNIAYLCRICHENQHWHLKKRQEKRYSEIKARGITEEKYFKEQKEAYQLIQSYLTPEEKKQERDFNHLRGMAIRAEKQGKKMDWINKEIIDK